MKYDTDKFPDRLQEIMDKRGVGPIILGRKAAVSPQTINNWLNRLCAPSMETLVRVADVLDITVDYLCGGYEKKDPPEKAKHHDLYEGRGLLDDKQVVSVYNQMVRAVNEFRPIAQRASERIGKREGSK